MIAFTPLPYRAITETTLESGFLIPMREGEGRSAQLVRPRTSQCYNKKGIVHKGAHHAMQEMQRSNRCWRSMSCRAYRCGIYPPLLLPPWLLLPSERRTTMPPTPTSPSSTNRKERDPILTGRNRRPTPPPRIKSWRFSYPHLCTDAN